MNKFSEIIMKQTIKDSPVSITPNKVREYINQTDNTPEEGAALLKILLNSNISEESKDTLHEELFNKALHG